MSCDDSDSPFSVFNCKHSSSQNNHSRLLYFAAESKPGSSELPCILARSCLHASSQYLTCPIHLAHQYTCTLHRSGSGQGPMQPYSSRTEPCTDRSLQQAATKPSPAIRSPPPPPPRRTHTFPGGGYLIAFALREAVWSGARMIDLSSGTHARSRQVKPAESLATFWMGGAAPALNI